jgi:quaternary ammonium compound-resistance protein SugE
MAWILLLLAGLLEVGWAAGLKASDGFSKPLPAAVTVVLMIGSFWLLALALRTIPLGTGYAVWTGIGAVGTALVGIVAFGESTAPARLASIALVLAGIVGLKLSADA